MAWNNCLLLWAVRDNPVARGLFLDTLAASTALASRNAAGRDLRPLTRPGDRDSPAWPRATCCCRQWCGPSWGLSEPAYHRASPAPTGAYQKLICVFRQRRVGVHTHAADWFTDDLGGRDEARCSHAARMRVACACASMVYGVGWRLHDENTTSAQLLLLGPDPGTPPAPHPAGPADTAMVDGSQAGFERQKSTRYSYVASPGREVHTQPSSSLTI